MNHIISTLKDIGLDDKEIDIYFACLKIGTTASSTIGNMLSIPKSTARYGLDNLVKKQILIKTQKGNTTLFTPEHPQKLKNLLIIEKNKIEEKEQKLNNVMGDLIGIFNPSTKIPKVTFYEGIEGIKKVLDDSLTAKEIIDTYVDIDSVGKFIPEINEKYTLERKKLNIKKRALISDSKYSKEYIDEKYGNDNINNIKFINPEKYDLHVSFMLYDGKISYLTMENNSFVGIIIENKQIYDFHKSLFKLTWDKI